ncbi:hypothetical protein Tco_1093915 [Tanacetum coccineum]|uniref:Uncharacterized protein n=1 Tax=Tanacetum coccineum TaxID=301880 RepID=A0ABQ5IG65_9ASTR
MESSFSNSEERDATNDTQRKTIALQMHGLIYFGEEHNTLRLKMVHNIDQLQKKLDRRPIYDEEPIAEVQMTVEINVFAIGQQHAEQPEFTNEGEFDQNAEQCHNIRPLLASSVVKPHHVIAYSKSRNSSKNILRFSSNDMVHNHYLEEDITNPYECKQTLDLSAGTSINVQKEQTLDLRAGPSINRDGIKALIIENLIAGRPW